MMILYVAVRVGRPGVRVGKAKNLGVHIARIEAEIRHELKVVWSHTMLRPERVLRRACSALSGSGDGWFDASADQARAAIQTAALAEAGYRGSYRPPGDPLDAAPDRAVHRAIAAIGPTPRRDPLAQMAHTRELARYLVEHERLDRGKVAQLLGARPDQLKRWLVSPTS